MKRHQFGPFVRLYIVAVAIMSPLAALDVPWIVYAVAGGVGAGWAEVRYARRDT